MVVSRISGADNNGSIMVARSLFDIEHESIVQDVVYLYDLLPSRESSTEPV